ncbi:MAG TPA: glycine zipper 2TM domain-containing protein, partial [Casimicrobiaceae bacterium]
VSAVPIREAGTAPREECWNETVSGGGNGSQVAGTIIGGVAGGLIGHQIGSGRGNTAATIAGTIGGAAVGNEIGRRNERGEEVVQRCRQVAGYADRVVGFDVVYRFQGREFATRLPYDPGPSLPVNVTVAPAAR